MVSDDGQISGELDMNTHCSLYWAYEVMNAGEPFGELTENAATLPVAVGGNLTQMVVSVMFCDTQWPFRNKPKKDGRARNVGAVLTLH